MTEIMWVRSHVERLLQDELNVCRAQIDSDDDYPFRRGTAACWVSVFESAGGPMVRVWSHAVIGVKPTVALLREVNEIQQRCLSTAIYWAGGQVVVSQTISPIGLTRPVLAQAMSAVGSVADDVGTLIAATFGGATPYPVEDSESEDEEAA